MRRSRDTPKNKGGVLRSSRNMIVKAAHRITNRKKWQHEPVKFFSFRVDCDGHGCGGYFTETISDDEEDFEQRVAHILKASGARGWKDEPKICFSTDGKRAVVSKIWLVIAWSLRVSS